MKIILLSDLVDVICHKNKNKNLKTLPSLLLHVLPNLFTGMDDRNPTSEERPPWEILYKREVTPCVVKFCTRVVHGRKRTKYFPSVGVMTIAFFFTVSFLTWTFGILELCNVRLMFGYNVTIAQRLHSE